MARTSNSLAEYDKFQSATFDISASTMPKQSKTIALIDDDPQIRASLTRLLSACGYRIDAFASGEDFLSVAAIGLWDGLLIDLHLGTISGLELAQHSAVKAMNLPIIIMSGMIDDGVWRQALALRCAGYLRKPVSSEDLLQALRHAGV